MKTKNKISVIVFLTMIVALVVTNFNSCTPPNEEKQIAVDPRFEQNPPIATSVNVAEDGEGKVLLTATFEPGAIDTTVHAMMVGDEKVVLRDDGTDGDETAADNVFSILVKEDEKSLLDTLQLNQTKQLGRAAFVQFKDRMIVEPDADKMEINRESMKNFKDLKTRVPARLMTVLPTDAEINALLDKSLMITDTAVVQDPTRTFNPCDGSGTPNGAWTFGKLMTDLANETHSGIDPVTFTKNWLDTWKTEAVINGDTVPARTNINTVLAAWQAYSGANNPLKMEALPFRLLAIVNRLDLRGNMSYGVKNSGEGRFVFGLIDKDTDNNNVCSAFPFTVIFEYGLNKRTCFAVKSFAQQWYDLKDITDQATYNTKLQEITDQFAGAGTNPDTPNKSSLNQLRTNEIFIGNPWELREFVIDSSHNLVQTTVKQEPSAKHNKMNTGTDPVPTPADIVRLAKFVNDNQLAVENNTFSVPESITGEKFLGGKSHTLSGSSYHWNGGAATPELITSDKARHMFSLQTCSGCHGGEGRTGNFLHVSPAPAGSVAGLSSFLTGLGSDAVADSPGGDDDGDRLGSFFIRDPANRPAGSATVRPFNDLLRRAKDLFELVNNTSCKVRVRDLHHALTFRPTRFVH